jgi:hypothetical protein
MSAAVPCSRPFCTYCHTGVCNLELLPSNIWDTRAIATIPLRHATQ